MNITKFKNKVEKATGISLFETLMRSCIMDIDGKANSILFTILDDSLIRAIATKMNVLHNLEIRLNEKSGQSIMVKRTVEDINYFFSYFYNFPNDIDNGLTLQISNEEGFKIIVDELMNDPEFTPHSFEAYTEEENIPNFP